MPEERRIEPAQTEDQAVTNFREYLRIKTVQPNPDYGKLRSVYSTWLKFGHNLNNCVYILLFECSRCNLVYDKSLT